MSQRIKFAPNSFFEQLSVSSFSISIRQPVWSSLLGILGSYLLLIIFFIFLVVKRIGDSTVRDILKARFWTKGNQGSSILIFSMAFCDIMKQKKGEDIHVFPFWVI